MFTRRTTRLRDATGDCGHHRLTTRDLSLTGSNVQIINGKYTLSDQRAVILGFLGFQLRFSLISTFESGSSIATVDDYNLT